MRPQYRQYDVYPKHNYAAAGATKYNRPFYDTPQGGRERPKQITFGESMSLSEGLVQRAADLSYILDEEAKAKPAMPKSGMVDIRRLPSDEEIQKMEKIIKKDPKALRMYKMYRMKYAVHKGLYAAFWAGLLLPFIMKPSALRAGITVFSGVHTARKAVSTDPATGRMHAKAVKQAYDEKGMRDRIKKMLRK